jgi:hypothetical protein
MDPATIAATITGLITPFLVNMGESAAEEVGAKLPGKLDQLWQAISRRFQGNPTAVSVSRDLAMNSQDTDNQEAFSLQLKRILKDDPGFAEMLSKLLQEAQNEIRNTGNQNIAVGEIRIDGDLSGNLTIGHNNQIGD